MLRSRTAALLWSGFALATPTDLQERRAARRAIGSFRQRLNQVFRCQPASNTRTDKPGTRRKCASSLGPTSTPKPKALAVAATLRSF